MRSMQAALVMAALAATSAPARAQTTSPGLALDRFDPAPAGDRMFGVPSPYAAGDLTPHVMLLGDYAHDPLVLRTLPGNQLDGAVVQSQLYLNLDAGLSLWSRVFVDVDVPVALYQHGGTQDVPAADQFTPPSSVQFGDLRIGARVRLFGEYQDPFQIAVGGFVWAPTGAKDAFVSTGQVRGLPQLILGGRVDERLVWSAAVGPRLRARHQLRRHRAGHHAQVGRGRRGPPPRRPAPPARGRGRRRHHLPPTSRSTPPTRRSSSTLVTA